MKKDSFGSRLGFILVSAGCAIGMGNVWRFPFITGENGGGLFVLIYLIMLALVGIPVLTMEFAIGRAGTAGVQNAFLATEKAGTKWHLSGPLCLIEMYIVMVFYSPLVGWVLSYFYKFLTGQFAGLTPEEIPSVYYSLLADPAEQTFWLFIIVALGFLVISRGLQNGLERISTVMMLALFALLFILAVYSLLLPGAKEGIAFFLKPDLGRTAARGIGNVFMDATSQAFYTLSIGMGAMITFGNYMGRDRAICGEAVRICALDTLVAVLSGLIIFAACFTFGVQPDQGKPLIFLTLPNVFLHMTGGRIWGALFFLFLTFAGFSTLIAVYETILANSMEQFGWSRKKAVWMNLLAVFVLSLPAILGYNVWSGVILPGGRNIFDMEDFVYGNVLLPLGSLIFTLYCSVKCGWGFDAYINEVNTGNGMKLPSGKAMRFYFRFVLPVLIGGVFLQGIL